ncbi:MAG: hypothetical protein ACM3X9_12660 [Bacillota bacterium]
MNFRKYYLIWGLFCGLLFLFLPIASSNSPSRPVVENLSTEKRKLFREDLVNKLIDSFREEQVFFKIREYMVVKAEELHKGLPSKLPDVLISDTFSKTGALFEHTKIFIGNTFANSYEPQQFEKNVSRYLWLKGIGFFILGIDDNYKMAVSYFYLPGNEGIKTELLKGIVHYSFPEVPMIAENKQWYDEMTVVMDKLGYRIFNINKFGL